MAIAISLLPLLHVTSAPVILAQTPGGISAHQVRGKFLGGFFTGPARLAPSIGERVQGKGLCFSAQFTGRFKKMVGDKGTVSIGTGTSKHCNNLHGWIYFLCLVVFSIPVENAIGTFTSLGLGIAGGLGPSAANTPTVHKEAPKASNNPDNATL